MATFGGGLGQPPDLALLDGAPERRDRLRHARETPLRAPEGVLATFRCSSELRSER